MSKIIPAKIIKNCGECEYCKYACHSGKYYCTTNNKELFTGKHADTIPSWCPLEDARKD